jgi:hypothetical protein
MKIRGNRNLTLAERPPATPALSAVETFNTLVGSFGFNSPEHGPSFRALDEAMESDGDVVAEISSRPAGRTNDLEQGIRSRVGKKQPSKEPTTPGVSQRDRSRARPRRFLKPLHFWIDSMHIDDPVRFPNILLYLEPH